MENVKNVKMSEDREFVLKQFPGASQDQIAEVLGTSQGNFSRWLSGHRNLSPDSIAKWARAICPKDAAARREAENILLRGLLDRG